MPHLFCSYAHVSLPYSTAPVSTCAFTLYGGPADILKKLGVSTNGATAAAGGAVATTNGAALAANGGEKMEIE